MMRNSKRRTAPVAKGPKTRIARTKKRMPFSHQLSSRSRVMKQWASRQADRAHVVPDSRGGSRRLPSRPSQMPAGSQPQFPAVVQDIPPGAFRAVLPASEQAVDKRSERRAFRSHEDRPQYEQKKDDGNQPPFLPDFQKVPKLFDDGQLVHGETRLFTVSNRRCAMILLPSALGCTG